MSQKIQSLNTNNQNNSLSKKTNLDSNKKISFINKYRTLDLGSYKMFFTYENNQLVYKFI
jgi:hypothetical protein